MKKSLLTFIFLSFSLPAWAFTLPNFEAPESVALDPDDGSYYVSNINGALAEKDGNGYISKINPSGNLVIQKFIGGKKEDLMLNAPKGMAILGKTLFVTDIDTIKGFDKESGKLVATLNFSAYQPKFLNDLIADENGFLYASDTVGNRIYKVDPVKLRISIFKEGTELGNPNGLLINPKSKNLMVVTWGTGQLLEIDRNGNVHVLKRSLMTLDGIDLDGQGNLYISSFEKGEIYKVPNYGRSAIATVMGGLTTPADIAYDRKKNELVIPSLKGNTVSAVTVKK